MVFLGPYGSQLIACFSQQPAWTLRARSGKPGRGIDLHSQELSGSFTVDSNTLEHGCRMIYAGVPSFFGLGSEDGGVPTLALLL